VVSTAGLFFDLSRLFSLGENIPYENVRMIKADNLGFFFYIMHGTASVPALSTGYFFPSVCPGSIAP
jgi:hypothetical protein